MWSALYHMIGPNMSDQKGNLNTSYVIGYQNVLRHRTQKMFRASGIDYIRQFSFQFPEGAVFMRLIIYNLTVF